MRRHFLLGGTREQFRGNGSVADLDVLRDLLAQRVPSFTSLVALELPLSLLVLLALERGRILLRVFGLLPLRVAVDEVLGLDALGQETQGFTLALVLRTIGALSESGIVLGLRLEGDRLELILLLVVPCLLYTSPSPRDVEESRMPSSA